MSSMSQFFGGGGIPVQLAVTASGTFVTPVAGKYLLTAIGGGGGGSNGGGARGGGAGGLAQSLVTLGAGVTLTLTVGAGGATGATGSAGGSTTISAPEISTLTANGGAGGNTTTATAGGTASGGNLLNVTGGSAGNTNGAGGGAVGAYGTTPAATTTNSGRSVGPLADQNCLSPSIFGGRLLQPSAGFIRMADNGTPTDTPAFGQAVALATFQSGAFAGGGSQTRGGAFGGGGGSSSAGGVGGVIIEYFLA